MHPARVKRATSRYRLDQGFGQQFTINKQSPQAKGLVFWLPFTDIRGQAKHIDLVSGLVLTESGTPVWVNDSERGWVMEFDSGSSESLSNTSLAPIDSQPITMAGWFNTPNNAVNTVFLSVGVGVTNTYFSLWSRGVPDLIAAEHREDGLGAGLVAYAATTYNINVWQHASCIKYNTIDIAVFLEGKNKGTQGTLAKDLSGLDRIVIGSDNKFAIPYDGLLTDVRIYNRALSDQEIYELYKNPWDLFKVREPQVWVTSPVSIISGEVVWGHDTGVLEANVRDFSDNWAGTGAIAGAGDNETLDLETTEYMISEVVYTDECTVTLLQNHYDPTGDDVDMDYRHGATEAACLVAGWNNYTVPFVSLNYVQIRMTSTL